MRGYEESKVVFRVTLASVSTREYTRVGEKEGGTGNLQDDR